MIPCKPLHNPGEREPVVAKRAPFELLVTFLLGISVSRSSSKAVHGDKEYYGVCRFEHHHRNFAHITTVHKSHNGALKKLISIASSKCKSLG